MTEDEETQQRRTLEALLGSPTMEGNRVTVLRNGDEIFPAMLEAIEGAERSIDLLTFVYWDGTVGRRFAEALHDAAGRGVRVRILLDAVGARRIGDELVHLVEDGGCELRWFRPVEVAEIGEVNHRTHRKVMVCDETIAFTGGVGIADEWSGDARNENEWRDTHFRVEGPAVDGLRAAFIDNWAETGPDLFDPAIDRFPAPTTDGPTRIQVVRGAAETGLSDIATMFHLLLSIAQDRVRITTAYFNPDEVLLAHIIETVERGVTVEILLPGPGADKRFAQLAGERVYEELLDNGVTIWSFQPSMLHAKILTVDGRIAVIGSANFNNRSTQFDEEVDLILHDSSIAQTLDDHFDHDVSRSVELDPARWADRSVPQKAAEKAMGAVKDLL